MDASKSLLGQGAWGISTGLSYVPGRFSPTEEVVEATRPVRKINGFYISHLRDQGDELLESIEETIRISQETGVRVVATHLKSSPKRNWGKGREAVALMSRARAEGVPIYGDLYPYETSSDGIDVSLVPPGLSSIRGSSSICLFQGSRVLSSSWRGLTTGALSCGTSTRWIFC